MTVEERPDDPPEEYEYVMVEGAADGVGEAGLQVRELCARDTHRVEKVTVDGEGYWSCVDCDLREPIENRQLTFDGRSLEADND